MIYGHIREAPLYTPNHGFRNTLAVGVAAFIIFNGILYFYTAFRSEEKKLEIRDKIENASKLEKILYFGEYCALPRK